jgi:hypothetical protein
MRRSSSIEHGRTWTTTIRALPFMKENKRACLERGRVEQFKSYHPSEWISWRVIVYCEGVSDLEASGIFKP